MGSPATPPQRLHKFHKRQVKSRAEGFVELAPDNEILLSASGRMLSFQSHPEMTPAVSQGLLDGDTQGFYHEEPRPNPRVVMDRDIYGEHDGALAWESIVDWVKSR